MSFNLSRTQFLQMFAVMQSIKLINHHTAKAAAPALLWKNENINDDQFSVLTSLLSSTPLMPSLSMLPSGSTAPILINPFTEGGYLPHSGPGFVVIPETGTLNIQENALFNAMETHISTAFTNLIRHANARADHVAMPGAAFASFSVDYDRHAPISKRAKLCFYEEGCEVAVIEVLLPHVFSANETAARHLIDIMRHFIGQSMIDADIAAGVLTNDSIHVVSDIPKLPTREPEKTLEQKLMECPTWATW
ncbi:hypothetical protein DN333_12250 [Salmonella enterica subsp. enterica]|nr:hypothetical protein [Salmonella enterica subsp. enterica]